MGVTAKWENLGQASDALVFGLAEARDLLVQSARLPGCHEDVRPHTEVGNGLLLNELVTA